MSFNKPVVLTQSCHRCRFLTSGQFQAMFVVTKNVFKPKKHCFQMLFKWILWVLKIGHKEMYHFNTSNKNIFSLYLLSAECTIPVFTLEI